MKNVLVIGGSYFIGRVFVEELRKQDEYSIYVMNRGNRPLNIEGVEEIICDRRDAFSLEQLVPHQDWHTVVDFCAFEVEDIELMLYCLQGTIAQYIYMSTATAIENSNQLPMKEDAAKVTGPMPGPFGDYGYKKWQAEMKVKETCEEKGIMHTSLRPSFVYGKYNYAPRESYFFDVIAQNKPFIVPPPPQSLFSTISVWDLVNVTIACMGNEKVFNKAFNAISNELISYDRIVEVLETITEKKFEVQRMPIFEIDSKRIPLPFPLEEHLIYDGTLLQDTLGYTYMSYLEGMRRTYNWFFKIDQ